MSEKYRIYKLNRWDEVEERLVDYFQSHASFNLHIYINYSFLKIIPLWLSVPRILPRPFVRIFYISNSSFDLFRITTFSLEPNQFSLLFTTPSLQNIFIFFRDEFPRVLAVKVADKRVHKEIKLHSKPFSLDLNNICTKKSCTVRTL